MTATLIILAYLIVGMFTGAILKYICPAEFEYDNSILVPIVILWPLVVVGYIGYIIGKVLYRVLNGMVVMIGATMEAANRVVIPKIPKIRWK